MASENETIADIIAEVRRNAESSQMGHKSFLAPRSAYWSRLAARLEAAWKRELESLLTKQGENVNSGSAVYTGENKGGNAAAMREALECAKKKALYISKNYTTPNSLTGNILKLLAHLNSALSAPPRNCDVGTAEEQDNRMDVYCQARKCESCPLWDNANNGVRCELAWAQMPYAAQKGADA